MSEINWVEWIGYGASVLVAVSLTMSSIVKLRWFNLAGSATFTGYGILIGASPVIAVNALIVFVNLFFIWKMYSQKDYFKIMEIKPDSLYLDAFLSFHQQEIKKEFPEFQWEPSGEQIAFLLLRNMAVAGVFLGFKGKDAALNIALDYVVPQYQDYKSGRFLLVQNQAVFSEKGFKTLVVQTHSRSNRRYFTKMGFSMDPINPSVFSKELNP